MSLNNCERLLNLFEKNSIDLTLPLELREQNKVQAEEMREHIELKYRKKNKLQKAMDEQATRENRDEVTNDGSKKLKR